MSVANETTVGLHLLQRLKEIGIDTVFGVPGDFNLNFLDILEGTKNIAIPQLESLYSLLCVFVL
jgi:pyruvate decarboxylase